MIVFFIKGIILRWRSLKAIDFFFTLQRKRIQIKTL